MNNFKAQYLSIPYYSETEELLHALAIKYEYECEKFDAELCLLNYGRVIFKYERVLLPDGKLIRESCKFARDELDKINKALVNIGIETFNFIEARKKVDRLSFSVLQVEYDCMPKEMMDKIKELMEL